MKLVVDSAISDYLQDYLPVLGLFLCGFLGWASSRMMQRHLQRLMPVRSPKPCKLEKDSDADLAEPAEAEELKGPSSPAARRRTRRQTRKAAGAPAGADAEAEAEPAGPMADERAPDGPAPVEPPVEPEAREPQKVSDRVAKMMAKKAERKARKAQEGAKCEPAASEQPAPPEEPTPPPAEERLECEAPAPEEPASLEERPECEAAAPDEPASLEERPEWEAAAPDEPASLEERPECEAATPQKPASPEEPAVSGRGLLAAEWADLEDEEGEWVRPPAVAAPAEQVRAWQSCKEPAAPVVLPILQWGALEEPAAPVRLPTPQWGALQDEEGEWATQDGGTPGGGRQAGTWQAGGGRWCGSPSTWKQGPATARLSADPQESSHGAWGSRAAKSPSQCAHAELDSWMVPFGELRSPGAAGAWAPVRSLVPPAPPAPQASPGSEAGSGPTALLRALGCIGLGDSLDDEAPQESGERALTPLASTRSSTGSSSKHYSRDSEGSPPLR